MTGALLGLPGGPGPLPDAIQTLYAIALGIVILRSVGKASSPQGWALAVPLAAALVVLAAGSVVTAIGSGLNDEPLREQGLAIGTVAGVSALAVLAIPRKASLRWASEPSILVIGGATALRLIAPYDPAILIGTAAMWFVGGLLIAHRCRQPV
ncbi:hypothetical protein [Spiribacter roseus]|uniref:hypothetical protein n=1 Tax=Spiribacter roseus TaxID=1855875 RepID=UPI0012FE7D35